MFAPLGQQMSMAMFAVSSRFRYGDRVKLRFEYNDNDFTILGPAAEFDKSFDEQTWLEYAESSERINDVVDAMLDNSTIILNTPLAVS